MELRHLGSGPALSIVGLGCNNLGSRLDLDASVNVVQAALELGVTHFDTAEMYGQGRSEAFLGRALGARRCDVVVATKSQPRPKDEPYEPQALARRIVEACEGSLRRLGTDYIDVFYQHFPDPAAPPEEAAVALDSLVTSGKVRHIALSNHSAEQLAAAHAIVTDQGLAPIRANQVQWSLLHREAEATLVPTARALEISVIPYYPLASGLLTGKYRPDEAFPSGSRLATTPYFASIATPDNFRQVAALSAYASSLGRSLIELALAWLVAQECVASVIAGASTPEQVRANIAAANVKLTADELAGVPTRP